MNIIETNLKFGALSNRKSTTRAILHHAEASKCTAEDIHRWHLQNGWSGAGIISWFARTVPSTDSGQKMQWALMPRVATAILLESALRGLT